MPSPARTFADRAFLFGGDYNPEQWDEKTWVEDVRLMQQAGVNAATVGVFSWSRLEPTPGTYTFDWLDRVLELLHDGGIGVILATPTASPPPWFSLAHPDALPVTEDGTRLWHGSRDTYCPSAPAYRGASSRIAAALAERYGRHPSLVAWHVHNEYGTFCYCDHVASAFQRWLGQRYGDLDALNAAWYTSFWSQHYGRWEEILPPRSTQYLHNPLHALDFRRFMSDELLECYREQRDIIGRSGSGLPVTSNFMLPTWNHLEQWSWGDELDLVSMDHYLDTVGPDGETHAAYAGDLSRSWAGGDPWLLMEQAAGIIPLHGERMASKAPGRMLRNSLSYIARGSQGALFFQWRAPAAGSEVWHSGLVPHSGEDSRIYRETCELGATLGRIAEVAAPPTEGPLVEADVAVLWHAEGWWALEHPALPSQSLGYSDSVRSVHRALWQLGLPVDFVRPGQNLSRYRLVLVPSLYAMDDMTVEALSAFVSGGGHLVSWYFTGVANEKLQVVAGGYPGRLRQLLGVRVDELHPLAPEETVRLSNGSVATTWSESVELTTATALISYSGGLLDGSPAVTRQTASTTGAGTAYYVSTQLDPVALRELFGSVAAAVGISSVLGSAPPPGVEVVRRRGAEHRYLFVLNHGSSDVEVTGAGVDLLSGEPSDAGLHLRAGAAAVLREQEASGAGSWQVVTAGPPSAPPPDVVRGQEAEDTAGGMVPSRDVTGEEST